MPPWARMLLHGGALVAVLCGYMLLMEGLGGFSTEYLHRQLIELGLVLYLYALFHAALKPGRWRSVLAALPLLLIYLVHDLFYLVFGKVFRLTNLAEFPELVQILPLGYSALLLVALLLPLGLYLLRLDWRRPRRLALWLAPLVLVAVAVRAAPETFARSFEQLAIEIVKYSDGKSVEQNGRLAMLAYREAQRSTALAELGPFHDRARYEQEMAARADELRPHDRRRNVHLIVLESFLDPRLFRDLRFSSPPVHPAFDKLFGDQLGLSKAPVFGGSTAQAEFEVLCGVPAFERFSSVEFNVFSGAAAHCLPGMLRDLGYRSVATNTYKPNFFNALPGYQGAGFSDSYFPEEFSASRETYLKLGDPGVEEFAFDRSLFEQNLQFVRSHRQATPRPAAVQLRADHLRPHSAPAGPAATPRTHRARFELRRRSPAPRGQPVLLPHRGDRRIREPARRAGPRQPHHPRLRSRAAAAQRPQHLQGPALPRQPRGQHLLQPHRHPRRRQGPGLPRDAPLRAAPADPRLPQRGRYCRKHACAFKDGSQRVEREAYLALYQRLMAHAAQ
jgi:hypothetical protein